MDSHSLQQKYARVLQELEKLLEDSPPKVPPQDCPGEKEIDGEYKTTLQSGAHTRVNRLDVMKMIFEDLFKGLNLAAAATLRICSVGCGDGSKDALLVQAFLAACPDTVVEYVGVDIVPGNCSEAEAALARLGAQHRLRLSFLCRDFEAEDLNDLGTFDLVNCCHVLYYVKDLAQVVDKVFSLARVGGRVSIALNSDGGLSPMRKILWRSEGKHHFWTSGDVERLLDVKSVKYCKSTFHNLQDFSKCVEENFQSLASKAVLDFACQTKMRWYSDRAVELCIQHITDRFESKPGLSDSVVTSPADILTAFV